MRNSFTNLKKTHIDCYKNVTSVYFFHYFLFLFSIIIPCFLTTSIYATVNMEHPGMFVAGSNGSIFVQTQAHKNASNSMYNPYENMIDFSIKKAVFHGPENTLIDVQSNKNKPTKHVKNTKQKQVSFTEVTALFH